MKIDFYRVPHPNDVPFDVIDLDDSDPELLLDIDANLQEWVNLYFKFTFCF